MSTTRQRVQSRQKGDRRLDLDVASRRIGYARETLRQMMFRGPDPKPPLFKVRGRWFVWESELDEWAIEQGLVLFDVEAS